MSTAAAADAAVSQEAARLSGIAARLASRGLPVDVVARVIAGAHRQPTPTRPVCSRRPDVCIRRDKRINAEGQEETVSVRTFADGTERVMGVDNPLSGAMGAAVKSVPGTRIRNLTEVTLCRGRTNAAVTAHLAAYHAFLAETKLTDSPDVFEHWQMLTRTGDAIDSLEASHPEKGPALATACREEGLGKVEAILSNEVFDYRSLESTGEVLEIPGTAAREYGRPRAVLVAR